MVYKVLGLMSGSSLDGLDIAYVHLQEGVSGTGTADKKSRKWEYNIQQAACYSYSDEWKARLAGATSLSAQEYLLLHVEFGRYIGEAVTHRQPWSYCISFAGAAHDGAAGRWCDDRGRNLYQCGERSEVAGCGAGRAGRTDRSDR